MAEWSEEEIIEALKTGAAADELKREFGEQLYEELREEVSAPPPVPAAETRRRKVYILPGIMGSRLERDRLLLDDLVWVDPIDLASGGVAKLRYATDDKIRSAGALSIAYLRMKLRLRRLGLSARYLSYDWRKPPAEEADRLVAKLKARGETDVTLIGHSMGGLVARGMAALDPQHALIRKVITIGTPNRGSYSPVQAFDLKHGLMDTLGKIDLVHTPREIMNRYVRHFPGLVEMMPDPALSDLDFFEKSSWPRQDTSPTVRTLQAARASKQDLAAPDSRFRQIIGVGETTVTGAYRRGGNLEFSRSTDGDGTVPRLLSEMGDGPKYYTHGVHMWQCTLTHIIDAAHALTVGDSLAGNPDFSTTPSQRVAPRAESIRIPPPWKDGDKPIGVRDILESIHDGAASAGAAPHLVPRPARAVVSDVGADQDLRRSGPNGYLMEHVMSAGRSWRETEAEREQIDAHVAAGVSTQAETPERMRLYQERIMKTLGADASGVMPELDAILRTSESVRGEVNLDALLRERIIGAAEEFLSVDFLKRGKLALNPVCRIVFTNDLSGYGTGFLVAPDVIITNNHVLPNTAYASASGAQFEYERDERRRDANDRVVELDPDRLFVTNEALDFTLVALKKTASPPHLDYGFLPLIGVEGKIRVSRPVNIIQHPEARRKEVVVRESYLRQLPPNKDAFAYYTGDTQPGSSGSPVANDRWEVIALHHSGVPDMDDQGYVLTQSGARWNPYADPDGKTIHWIANEGVRISRIMEQVDLELASGFLTSGAQALLQSVVDAGKEATTRGAFYWLKEWRTPPEDGGFGTVDRPPAERASERPSGPVFAERSDHRPSGAGSAVLSVPLTIQVSIGGGDAMAVIEPEGTVDHVLDERRRADDYADRPGYDPEFLGRHVPFPRATNAIRRDVSTISGSDETELRYDTFSVMMSRSRRLAYVSGGNYDPDAPYHARRRNPWGYDPRLPRSLQAGNDHYRNNPLDRGHLFRAAEGAWGESADAAQRASDDTFHWTNIAPQHEVFNQSGRDRDLSIWGQIENHLMDQARDRGGRRMSSFNGPVLRPDDPENYGLKTPMSYWKVAVMREGSGLRCLAFVLSQESLINRLESLSAGRFGVFQIKLRDLEALVGLDFGDLRAFDAMERIDLDEALPVGAEFQRVERFSDIVN